MGDAVIYFKPDSDGWTKFRVFKTNKQTLNNESYAGSFEIDTGRAVEHIIYLTT